MPKPGFRSLSLADELYGWFEELAQKKHTANPVGKVPSVPDMIKYVKEEYEKMEVTV